MGICGKIVAAKSSGKSLLDVATEVKESGTCEAILLLDHDRRGKEWTARLKNLLEHEGVVPNIVVWTKLFGLVGKEVKDVEGLASYMETLKSRLSKDS
jgi:5S rRNA maturation endonuclease (ribonuclease M5)